MIQQFFDVGVGAAQTLMESTGRTYGQVCIDIWVMGFPIAILVGAIALLAAQIIKGNKSKAALIVRSVYTAGLATCFALVMWYLWTMPEEMALPWVYNNHDTQADIINTWGIHWLCALPFVNGNDFMYWVVNCFLFLLLQPLWVAYYICRLISTFCRNTKGWRTGLGICAMLWWVVSLVCAMAVFVLHVCWMPTVLIYMYFFCWIYTIPVGFYICLKRFMLTAKSSPSAIADR